MANTLTLLSFREQAEIVVTSGSDHYLLEHSPGDASHPEPIDFVKHHLRNVATELEVGEGGIEPLEDSSGPWCKPRFSTWSQAFYTVCLQ
jgi:hypothetical protein